MEIQELPGITRFIPKIVLAITVTICDEVYKKIAYWLNDMGKSHKTKLTCDSKDVIGLLDDLTT